MTKRDVALWFCRVLAWAGLWNAGMGLLGWISGLLGFPSSWNTSFALIPVAFYIFVLIFAEGIATELSAEGPDEAPLQNKRELAALSLRCIGFSLFLSGSIAFCSLAVSLGYMRFFQVGSFGTLSAFYWPQLIIGFIQSLLGFALAFGPRLRRFIRGR